MIYGLSSYYCTTYITGLLGGKLIVTNFKRGQIQFQLGGGGQKHLLHECFAWSPCNKPCIRFPTLLATCIRVMQ